MKNLSLLRSATFFVSLEQLCLESQTICILFTTILHFQYSISQIVSPDTSSRHSLREQLFFPNAIGLRKMSTPASLNKMKQRILEPHSTCDYPLLFEFPWTIPPMPQTVFINHHREATLSQSSVIPEALLVSCFWDFLIGANSLCDHLAPQHFDLRNFCSLVIGF